MDYLISGEIIKEIKEFYSGENIDRILTKLQAVKIFAIGELHMMGEAYVNSKDKKGENVEAWVNRMIAKKPIKYRGKGMIIKLEVQHE